MTVICWDGITLASDSRLSNDNSITTDSMKKLYKLDNIIYFNDVLLYAGFSGVFSDVQKVLHFLEESRDYKGGLEHELDAIIVGRDYVYELENNKSYLLQYDRAEKLSTGSGASFAKSAMRLGLTAKDAVKHAMTLDLYCGGKIQGVRP